jgi:hypothetical protein
MEFVAELMAKMTLDEKIGQLNSDFWNIPEPPIVLMWPRILKKAKLVVYSI